MKDYIKKNNAIKVPFGFSYNSLNNTDWESVDSLRNLISQNIY